MFGAYVRVAVSTIRIDITSFEGGFGYCYASNEWL